MGEQLIFPYDKIKNAYSCWHITPIQIVAELRDPNKLKKPKRPDLIQAQAALPLPYRNNPADLAINGFPYDTTSDEESDHKSRLMMDIKREPVDMINESMMSNGHGSVDGRHYGQRQTKVRFVKKRFTRIIALDVPAISW